MSPPCTISPVLGCGHEGIFNPVPSPRPLPLSSLVTGTLQIEPLCVCEIVNVCACVFSRIIVIVVAQHHRLVLIRIPRATPRAVGLATQYPLSDLRSLSTRPYLFRSVKEVASTETRPAVPVVLPTLRLAVATRVRRCGGLGRAQWPRAR